MPRLFLAVRPPEGVLSQIDSLPRPSEGRVRWVPPEQWHVTVRFFGEAAEDEVVAAMEQAAPALARLAPVHVELGPQVSRLGRAVICIPADGLTALAGVIAEATGGIGAPVDPRPFRGHVTLARLRDRGSCRLAGHRIAASFDVTGVELVRSQLGHEGARHEVVRTFPLGG